MGKTTIDGLAVRSSTNRPRSQLTQNSYASVDIMTAKKSNTTPHQYRSRPQNHKRPYNQSNRGPHNPNSHGSRYKKYKMKSRQEQNRTAMPAAMPPEVDIEQLIHDEIADEGFLDPVESFDYKAPSPKANSFVQGNNSDWSDLLGEMNRGNNAKLALQSGLDDDEDEIDDSWVHEWNDNSPLAEEVAEEDEEIPEEQPRKKSKRRRHKRFSVGKVLALATLVLLLAGGGALYFWGDGLISRLTGGRSGLWDTLSAIVSDTVPFETDADGRTNVLVFGTGGYNMNGDLADGQHDGAQLTDSLMVISFNQETKDVALLSLPRDLKVPMACMAGKINEVFSCYNKDGTDEQAGAQALMKQVGSILDIDFQYYAHVNWASLTSIIDTIGGITVTLDEDINDYGWTNAVAHAGVPIEVDGEQALGLARARHGTSGGDFTRGNTQQKIVEGIVEKIVGSGIGVNEALGLLNILGDNLRSNFSADNIKAAVQMVSGFSISNIRQVPLVDYDNNIYYVNSETINDISYVVPSAGTNNYTVIQDYIKSMFSDSPIAREKAAIAIYNATDGFGVASSEREKLEAAGFIVASVGDADSTTCQDNYCVYVLNPEKAGTQRALADRYGVSVRGADELPAELQGGADFVVIIGKVAED